MGQRLLKSWTARVCIALSLFLLLTAEDCSPGKNAALKKDRATAARQLTGFQNNQPVPVFTYSQLRQNLIELETAQAQTTQTTTFFFNQGVQQPVADCPSIGFPIPSTAQLTAPDAKYNGGSDAVVPQIEATGVYTGVSTGTYVICVDAQARPYANYWEGFVQTVTGPATWQHDHIELTGPPSFNFTKGKN